MPRASEPPEKPPEGLAGRGPSRPRRPIEWIVWGGVVLTIAVVTVAMVLTRLGSREVALPLRYPVPEFNLTNQFGQPVTLANLRGNVWVADIIFTRCAGPCPIMTGRMAELQSQLRGQPGVKLVTLTTDPENDTPEVLKNFGRRFDADFGQWWFLTGRKEEIARVAVDGLKLIARPKDPAERQNDADLFIHSELFVVVDKRGDVRAAFESYAPEALSNIRQAVKQLAKER